MINKAIWGKDVLRSEVTAPTAMLDVHFLANMLKLILLKAGR